MRSFTDRCVLDFITFVLDSDVTPDTDLEPSQRRWSLSRKGVFVNFYAFLVDADEEYTGEE